MRVARDDRIRARSARRFDTEEEALAHARAIVDGFVDDHLERAKSVDDLRRQFVMFGETPVVTRVGAGNESAQSFSAMDHLMARAEAHFGSKE